MIFGIFAKNQITAGTLTTSALLVLMMIPMFSGLNAALRGKYLISRLRGHGADRGKYGGRQ